MNRFQEEVDRYIQAEADYFDIPESQDKTAQEIMEAEGITKDEFEN